MVECFLLYFVEVFMKVCIFLVEDDEFIGFLVIVVLLNVGYEVLVVFGLEDVKMFDLFGFLVVVMDFQLLGGDGCDVIDYMWQKMLGMLVLLILGYGNWVVENCINCGMDNVYYLGKLFWVD